MSNVHLAILDDFFAVLSTFHYTLPQRIGRLSLHGRMQVKVSDSPVLKHFVLNC